VSDVVGEGVSRESVRHIEQAFKDAFRLSRFNELGRGGQSSVEYVKDSGTGVVDPDGLLSLIRLRCPTARGSALYVELGIWDEQGMCRYRVTYVGKEGAPSSGSSKKTATKLVKDFERAV
jgi:hypothetical protein